MSEKLMSSPEKKYTGYFFHYEKMMYMSFSFFACLPTANTSCAINECECLNCPVFLGARAVAKEEVAHCGCLLLRRKRSWRDQTYGGQSLTITPQSWMTHFHYSHIASITFDTWISLKFSQDKLILAAYFNTLGHSFLPRQWKRTPRS